MSNPMVLPRSLTPRLPFSPAEVRDLSTIICEHLADGETLTAICRQEGFPTPATFLRWVAQDAELAERYATAELAGFHAMAESTLAIADDDTGDVARDRLRIDTRYRYLSKRAAKFYGDKVQLDHSGGILVGDVRDLSDAELMRLARRALPAIEHEPDPLGDDDA